MKVRFSDRAEADLEAIGDYIELDNPRRAFTFVRELRARCRDIGSFPLSCPLIPRYEASGYRRAVFGRYLIFYRIRDDVVQIGYILNGAINYEPIVFGEEADDT